MRNEEKEENPFICRGIELVTAVRMAVRQEGASAPPLKPTGKSTPLVLLLPCVSGRVSSLRVAMLVSILRTNRGI